MNEYFSWSVLVVGIFAIVQGYFLFLTYHRMRGLDKFFDGVDNLSADEESEPGITQIRYSNIAKEFKTLIDSINSYIKKSGMADFGIIKDKTERLIESKYDYAIAYISYPTLLGLLGTFFGVVCGLVAFNQGLGQENAIVDKNVSKLIQGVIISMMTSVVGLIMMMVAQGYATKKKKETEGKRDNFYNFLQMDLLPANSKDTASAIGKLNRTVGSFIKKFQECTERFSTTFTENTDRFISSFGDGTVKVYDAVNQLYSTATGIGENIRRQGEIVERQAEILRQMQSEEVSGTLAAFVSAANSFSTATSAVQELDRSKEQVIAATSSLVQRQEEYLSSLEVPRQVAERLANILDRFSTFEQSINNLGDRIHDTAPIQNTQMNAIEEQLAVINRRFGLATSYQGTADEALERFYEDQIGRLQSLMGRFDQTLANFQISFDQMMAQTTNGLQSHMGGLDQTFANCSNDFDRMMQQFTEEMRGRREAFERVLSESFDVSGATDELKCLRDLPAIREELSRMGESLSGIKDLRSTIETLSNSIASLQEELNKNHGDKSPGKNPTHGEGHWYDIFTGKGKR